MAGLPRNVRSVLTWSGRRASLALLLAGLTVAAGSAQRGQVLNPIQGPPRPQTALPQFRSQVDLIHLDVSVLDGNRRPVRGLGPNDFTILENGQPQKLAVFNAVEIPVAHPPKTAWLRDVAPDVRSNNEDQRERRLFLILIDDAAVQGLPMAMQNVKKVAKDFINRLGPSDLAGVVFTLNNRSSQDFTVDRARLLAAVDKYTGGFRDMGGDNSSLFPLFGRRGPPRGRDADQAAGSAEGHRVRGAGRSRRSRHGRESGGARAVWRRAQWHFAAR